MLPTQPDQISQIDDHKDLAELQEHDFPAQSLTRAKAILTAKTMISSDLACFFTKVDSSERFVVLFNPSQGFRPALDGDDMRGAEIGAIYELTIFVSPNAQPVVDRADAIT